MHEEGDDSGKKEKSKGKGRREKEEDKATFSLKAPRIWLMRVIDSITSLVPAPCIKRVIIVGRNSKSAGPRQVIIRCM